MGNNNSNLIKFPNENNYFVSYKKQYDYQTSSDVLESIDLSNFMNNNDITFIYQIIFNQIRTLGYSIKLKEPVIPVYSKNSTIKQRIDAIEKLGFMSSDYRDILSDLIFDSKCYFPRIENIKSLLSDGHILLAGIVLDKELVKSISSEYHFRNQITDIICIVGYNSESLLIKTKWVNETINLENKFITNLQEIWRINIESPENKIISKIK